MDKATVKEKDLFKAFVGNAFGKENELKNMVLRIKNHMSELEETANRSRGDISRLYNELRAKLIERETGLKKQIADTLDKE